MTETDVVERKRSADIPLHGPEDFEGMRRAGRMVAECLDMLTEHVRPGVTTEYLDRLAFEFIRDNGAYPACLHYRGYTKTICTSINHVVCHGIPGDRKLADGDIINVDVTTIVDGWHGDTSRMFYVGKVGIKAQKLVDVTYDAMMRGIEAVKPGASLGDIGQAIQTFAEGARFSVVRDFCGHGIGRVFHDSPSVLHFGRKGMGPALREDMFFTEHPSGRYSIGDRTPDLAFGEDGSLEIVLSHDQPAPAAGGGTATNWLPIPEGPFVLMMRLYLPGESVIDGTYELPPVEPRSVSSE